MHRVSSSGVSAGIYLPTGLTFLSPPQHTRGHAVKPLTIKVINPPATLVADKRYEIVCQSTGSRPNAIITWYKGKRQMRRTRDETVDHNTTTSTLSFAPTTEDDGKTLTCRAENPNVNGLFLETDWKMNVVCEYTGLGDRGREEMGTTVLTLLAMLMDHSRFARSADGYDPAGTDAGRRRHQGR